MKETIINIILFITISIFFTACSSKDVITPKDTKTKVIETNSTKQADDSEEFSMEDEFLDEFSEEMAVEEKSDPFSGYNRAMTTFNDVLFRNVLTPTARVYKAILPEGARQSVKNFFHNLLYPLRGINNLLQGKFSNTAEETGRFVINTTIGIFGLFDPARSWFGLEPHEEDFGQTLGYYGVGSGPHIVLPIFGPSNLRDMFSMYPDSYADTTTVSPTKGMEDYHIAKTYPEYIGLEAIEQVNYVSLHHGEYESLTGDAIDLYSFLRDTYEQRRKKLIEE
jgi:phospholipid-binding lipoprotein MlaA